MNATLENKVKAFIECFKKMNSKKGIKIGEIKAIAKEYEIDQQILFDAFRSGDTFEAAKILEIDQDTMADAVEKYMKAN